MKNTVSRPAKYALIGSGKVARHFEHYLQSLHLDVETWNRRSGLPLEPVLKNATHVLLAVSDPSIGQLAGMTLPGQVLVHFSGASVVDGVFAAHPLMTFGTELESLDWYKEIPFVLDPGVSLSHILPGLNNPAFAIARDKRPLYHSLCALAGNSAFLMWQKIGERFESDLSLPRTLLEPFLHQVVHNAFTPDSTENYTGPVARQDWPTVRKHLQALESQPELHAWYKCFIQQAASRGIAVPEEFL